MKSWKQLLLQAAARRYFRVPASALSPAQAALLAGAIINPRALNPARPTPRLLRRQRIIMRRMGAVTPPPATPSLPSTVPAIPPGEAPIQDELPPPESQPQPETPPPLPAPCPVPPCGGATN